MVMTCGIPARHDAHAPYTDMVNSWLCATATRCRRNAASSDRAKAGETGRSSRRYSIVTPEPSS
jgi:hypothetical protein